MDTREQEVTRAVDKELRRHLMMAKQGIQRALDVTSRASHATGPGTRQVARRAAEAHEHLQQALREVLGVGELAVHSDGDPDLLPEVTRSRRAHDQRVQRDKSILVRLAESLKVGE